jgi:uncharacterized membrane protein YfcA
VTHVSIKDAAYARWARYGWDVYRPLAWAYVALYVLGGLMVAMRLEPTMKWSLFPVACVVAGVGIYLLWLSEKRKRATRKHPPQAAREDAIEWWHIWAFALAGGVLAGVVALYYMLVFM